MFSFGFLLVLIMYLAYMGWMYENAGFMTLAYMASVLFVLSFFILLYRKYTIKGSIKIPIGISEEGKSNLVKLVITNKGFLQISRLKAIIYVEDTLLKKKKKYVMKVAALLKGTHAYESNISFSSPGNYEITFKALRVYDITGLLYRNVKVRKWKNIQVMPNIHDVPITLTEGTKHFYGESDTYEDSRAGHDNSELLQIREFKAGDRLQNIHWKMSAKQDELMVKENSMPRSCPVVLFLDFKGDKAHRKNMISFIEIASSISFSLMDAGCMHYVAWYSEADMDITRVKIDNEASLYYFIELAMKNKWETNKEDISVRYGEKYYMEPYIWKLALDEELVLKKQDEFIKKYAIKDLEKEISSTEILL
ncbi:MAG: DUF58 domain-containing protein [Lachnospiraceae bacterium]|nr:DUF58 domain-containing protein [Lachnospiraceae bacterium]